MACQLDAGAKIYSLRVDTVHQQVMKLVESCIFTEKQAKSKKAGEDTDSDDEADHDQPGTSTGTTKGKKWKVITRDESIPKETFLITRISGRIENHC